MKRLCVYLTYDKQNIVDAYIGYMLRELKTCVDYLAVVCNETKIVRGLNILEEYADSIFFRENKGFDAGGFKDAMCNLIGWDIVYSFDELVLVNDSFFGPFCEMTEIFREMDKRNVDFWGLSKHAERRGDGIPNYFEHIQSFFLVIKNDMLHSESFKQYWENMPYYSSIKEVILKHETIFTSYFAKQGFSYDCLANMDINDSKNLRNNFIQYAFLSYELIRKRKFPFLKKQPLAWNNLLYQTQENPRLALEYIEMNTDYDINLIWDNIIRTLDISDLYRTLHLQYIVPSKMKKVTKYQKAVVIAVFVEVRESAEYIMEYLEKIKDVCNIIVYSYKSELLEAYKIAGYQYKCVNDIDDYINILGELGNSEYVCILHDADVTGEKEPSYCGKSYLFNIWENLLKDDSHIDWIIERFEKESRLGLLASPNANYGKYFCNLGTGWGGNFEKVKYILEQMKIACLLSYDKPPVIMPNNFWIRGNILKMILRKVDLDISLLPYLWCYIAQGEGYYSGIVESADYASINEINLQYYLDVLIEQIKHQCGDFNSFIDLRKNISRNAVGGFCQRFEHIYIYGTGIIAKRYREAFSNVEAYIVSDGQPKEDKMDGIKILYISEVSAKSNAGIIVCMSEEKQMQVVPLIKKMGWYNYLCIQF